MKRTVSLTIRQRLLLAGLLPAGLVALLVSFYFMRDASEAMDRSIEERGLAIVAFLAPASEYGLISGNRDSLAALLQAALSQHQVQAAAVVDERGATLAVTGALTLPQLASLRQIEGPQGVGRTPTRLSFAAPVLRSTIDLGEGADLPPDPVGKGRERLGWVYAEIDLHALRERKALMLLTDLALVGLALLATSLLAVRLGDAVSRPIRRLAEAVGTMARGRHDTRVSTDSGGELGTLERGFNEMAAALEAVHREMQARIDEATAQFRHQADHDPLSGLPNRRAFERETESAIKAGRRRGDAHALCYIDLDRFKLVNDTCGHAAGDELLRRVGRLLRDLVRDGDMVARVGGDEFAVLLRDCTLCDAREIAESLRAGVAAFRFTWDRREFAVGASIGLVSLAEPGCDLQLALTAADRACIEAKRSGRNRVSESTPRPDTPAPTDSGAPVSLSAAIEASRLGIVAHPMVEVGPGTLRWAELLVRLDHGQRGSTEAFLAGCSRSGEGLALDLWVLRAACERIAGHRAGGMVRLSLNLGSGSLAAGGAYATEVASELGRSGVAPSRLGFEIAAELAAQYPVESALLTARLRQIGCVVVLDAFRDHAPSLLKDIQPDFVKIRFDQLEATYGPRKALAVACATGSIAASHAIGIILGGIAHTDSIPEQLRTAAQLLQGDALAPEQALEAWLDGLERELR